MIAVWGVVVVDVTNGCVVKSPAGPGFPQTKSKLRELPPADPVELVFSTVHLLLPTSSKFVRRQPGYLLSANGASRFAVAWVRKCQGAAAQTKPSLGVSLSKRDSDPASRITLRLPSKALHSSNSPSNVNSRVLKASFTTAAAPHSDSSMFPRREA